MTRKNSTTRANVAAPDLGTDLGVDLDFDVADPTPPPWYPLDDWAEPGTWFDVPERIREAYAAHRRLDAGEIRQWLTPTASIPTTRKPPEGELPDGISVESSVRRDPWDERRSTTYYVHRSDGSMDSAIAVAHQKLVKRLLRAADAEDDTLARVEADSRPCVVCGRVSNWKSMARLERYGAAGYRNTSVIGYAHHGVCSTAVMSAARDAARMTEVPDGRTAADVAALWVEDMVDDAGPESLVRFKVAGKGIAG